MAAIRAAPWRLFLKGLKRRKKITDSRDREGKEAKKGQIGNGIGKKSQKIFWEPEKVIYDGSLIFMGFFS